MPNEESTPLEEQALVAMAQAMTEDGAKMFEQYEAPPVAALQAVLNLAGIVASSDPTEEWLMHCASCLRAVADDIQKHAHVALN